MVSPASVRSSECVTRLSSSRWAALPCTARAAAAVKGAAKVDSSASRRCWAGASSCQLQATTRRIEAWRASWPLRGPGRSSRSSLLAASLPASACSISWGLKLRTRLAASSMAKGKPPNARTSAATAPAWRWLSLKSARAARARSVNSATAGLIDRGFAGLFSAAVGTSSGASDGATDGAPDDACSATAVSCARPGSGCAGSGKGCRSVTCSPSSASARREVASTCSSGHSARSAPMAAAAGSSSCSQLSSTSRLGKAASPCAMCAVSAAVAGGRCRAAASAASRSAALRQDTSGTKTTCASSRPLPLLAWRPAASTASRVLPAPPGPSTVTRRCVCSSAASCCSIGSAPNRLVR